MKILILKENSHGNIRKDETGRKSILCHWRGKGDRKAIAQALAEAGSDLALIDIDIEETEKTAGEIEKERQEKSDRHSGRCKQNRKRWMV